MENDLYVLFEIRKRQNGDRQNYETIWKTKVGVTKFSKNYIEMRKLHINRLRHIHKVEAGSYLELYELYYYSNGVRESEKLIEVKHYENYYNHKGI